MTFDSAESFGRDEIEYSKQKVTRREQVPVVIISLPFAYQDGMDKYNGVMRYLRETGTDWELRIVRDTLDVDQLRRAMSKHVDGVICGTAGCFDGERRDAYLLSECLGLCQRRKIPLVGLDWPLEEFKWQQVRQCSFFNIDSEMIGRVAARTVMEVGEHAAYAFVGMFPSCAWSRNRGAFFAKELRRARHHNVRIFPGDPLMDESALRDWLKEIPKPAAVFAANDCAADIVLKICRRNGFRVPEDMSVIGVDDDPIFCVHTRPTLTSVHPDFEEMGYRAAGELARILSGRSRGGRFLVAGEPTVTRRMSTAPCSPSGMLIRRVDEIIEARACQNISSNVIADELKISRRLLDLRYRQYNGMSIREAIVRMRVRRAKHLLAYSSHSLGTVCRMCGYRTESYLGKIFFAREGVTMSDYRARSKSKG